MEKIVIIGSSGAGKSTLARKLGSILKIKIIHLDRVFWKRNWEKIARDKRIDILEEIVMKKEWIIEGSYPLSSAPVLNAADTIIFLDMARFLCLWRIINRHYNILPFLRLQHVTQRYRNISPFFYIFGALLGIITIYPLFLCLRPITKHHHKEDGRRRDLREGSLDKFDWRHAWNVLTFPYRGKKTFEQMLSNCQPGQEVRWLRSPKEVEEFLAQQVPTTDNKRSSSNRSVLVGATTGN